MLSEEDLLQDAYLIYRKVTSRYDVDNLAWLMSLFSTALRNHIYDYARKHRLMHEADPALRFRESGTASDGEGLFAAAIAQLSVEARDVLVVVLNAPVEVLVSTGCDRWIRTVLGSDPGNINVLLEPVTDVPAPFGNANDRREK